MDEFFSLGIPNFDSGCCHFYHHHHPPGETPPFPCTSAFVPYAELPGDQILNGAGGSSSNMNKRVLGFLTEVSVRPAGPADFDRQRGFRHMLSERSRRERQKRSYDALLAQLPPGTKNDKNSIVQAATREILKLSREREELLRRCQETNGCEEPTRRPAATNVKVRVTNATSGSDSFLVVLKCLQNLGVKMTAIRTEFSERELFIVVEIENEIEAAEVEKAIHSALRGEKADQIFPIC
ncbi:hypothetical protein MLD38_018090 [Melastoma candidum]|uniref:Uncharacterized protein n=1 Tax=Melastoma candidum TaxID=119954 RepID=A0ACB9QSN0_9MYRT|nr:hypothetical protein MLD38_018090 [Melastoma candidum]